MIITFLSKHRIFNKQFFFMVETDRIYFMFVNVGAKN